MSHQRLPGHGKQPEMHLERSVAPVTWVPVLSAVNVSRYHGGATILDGVSVSIGPDTRMGVVGPNGIGKSTLLRILAGLEEADAGRVERAPAALTVGYLPQEPDARAGETLRAYPARRTGVAAAEADLDHWTAELEHDPSVIEAYT